MATTEEFKTNEITYTARNGYLLQMQHRTKSCPPGIKREDGTFSDDHEFIRACFIRG